MLWFLKLGLDSAGCSNPRENQSLLNPFYEGSLPPVYIITLLMGIWAFFSSGGSLHNLNALCTRRKAESETS
ncbi:hypothetical protein E1301_Tti015522 [Triplophysa tibetana]|uniref:Uncharacterized protein n=1 Tax=Triplophysa tibetana TaxID=1572043 RepID=A0A5A9N0S1_9TELE|nr:hypothetical protein E1301_Tti015522 [Triplophysa tibetana]